MLWHLRLSTTILCDKKSRQNHMSICQKKNSQRRIIVKMLLIPCCWPRWRWWCRRWVCRPLTCPTARPGCRLSWAATPGPGWGSGCRRWGHYHRFPPGRRTASCPAQRHSCSCLQNRLIIFNNEFVKTTMRFALLSRKHLICRKSKPKLE